MAGRVLSNFHFELETGNLATDQTGFDRVEAGRAPVNLIQSLEVGKLFVASAAVLALPTEESGIVSLCDILKVQDYGTVESDAYEHLDVDGWDKDDYISYGRWLNNVVRAPRQQLSPISQMLLRQAYYLGIGPPESRIARPIRFGSMPNFYEAIGAVQERKRNMFNSWTDSQLADHAEKVLLELFEETGGETGYVDLNAEIDRRAKDGPFPSCEIFRRDGRYPMKYLIEKGYVDTLGMEPEDYVQWGVNFRLANDGKLPTERAVRLLSRTRRAPSWDTFMDNFRWSDYLVEVDTAYQVRKQQNAQEELQAVRKEVEAGKLPDYLLKGEPEQVAARRAKWLLINEMFPRLPEAHKRVIAQFVDAGDLKEVLLYTGNACMHEEDVKFAAVHVGVEEELWPTEEKPPFPYLRVPEGLLKRQVVTSSVV
jgi:hypothetical protein